MSYNILTDFNADIQADDDINDVAKVKMQTMEDSYPSTMDYLFLTALILFWIFAIVSSFLVDTHPVFLIISVILLVIVLIVGAEISNSYEELSEETLFSTGDFPITHYILSHLVIVILFIAFSILIALYAKTRAGGGF